MTSDPIGRVLIVLGTILFALVALREEWVIRTLSYGRRHARDINPGLRRAVRIIAAVSAVWGVVLITWDFIAGSQLPYW